MVRKKSVPQVDQQVVLECTHQNCVSCGQKMWSDYDNFRTIRTLSGVEINAPDLTKFEESLEELQIVQIETLGASACSRGGASGAASFKITGKSGLPPLPTDPLSSDSIYVEGESLDSDIEQTSNNLDDEKKETDFNQDSEKKVVLVETTESISIDDFVPARGAIVLENGDVILTPYSTSNNQRIPDNRSYCPPS